MPTIRMLRTLATKPDAEDEDQRYEGHVYDVPKDEAIQLVKDGIAVDLADPDAKLLVVDEKGKRRMVPASRVPAQAPPPRDTDDDDEDEDDEDEGDDTETEPAAADDLEAKTVNDLKAIAVAEAVTVTSLRKDDLIAAIRKARQAKAAG